MSVEEPGCFYGFYKIFATLFRLVIVILLSPVALLLALLAGITRWRKPYDRFAAEYSRLVVGKHPQPNAQD